jgi:hypothetical protein
MIAGLEATIAAGVAAQRPGAVADAAVTTADAEEQVEFLRKQIARSYSSLAELYMTDLCFEENAETECEAAVVGSLQYDPGSLDGRCALASLRLSQQRPTEALTPIAEVS